MFYNPFIEAIARFCNDIIDAVYPFRRVWPERVKPLRASLAITLYCLTIALCGVIAYFVLPIIFENRDNVLVILLLLFAGIICLLLGFKCLKESRKDDAKMKEWLAGGNPCKKDKK